MDSKWNDYIEEQMKLPYFTELRKYIKAQQANVPVFPENNMIFNAFALCPYYDLKVVILGGEPYTDGSDHGLAWSRLKGTRSEAVANIYREVFKDEYAQWMRDRFNDGVFGDHFRTNNLTAWAKQGILLLNILLTAEKGKSGAHKNKGWETFAANTMKFISDNKTGIVFMLWGKSALEMAQYIDRGKHLVLEASHPSPHTAGEGFFGCQHFAKAKEYLLQNSKENKPRTIGWFLPDR